MAPSTAPARPPASVGGWRFAAAPPRRTRSRTGFARRRRSTRALVAVGAIAAAGVGGRDAGSPRRRRGRRRARGRTRRGPRARSPRAARRARGRAAARAERTSPCASADPFPTAPTLADAREDVDGDASCRRSLADWSNSRSRGARARTPAAASATSPRSRDRMSRGAVVRRTRGGLRSRRGSFVRRVAPFD